MEEASNGTGQGGHKEVGVTAAATSESGGGGGAGCSLAAPDPGARGATFTVTGGWMVGTRV